MHSQSCGASCKALLKSHREEEAARVQEELSGVIVSVTIFRVKFAFVWRMKSVCGLCWTKSIPPACGYLVQRDTNVYPKVKVL